MVTWRGLFSVKTKDLCICAPAPGRQPPLWVVQSSVGWPGGWCCRFQLPAPCGCRLAIRQNCLFDSPPPLIPLGRNPKIQVRPKIFLKTLNLPHSASSLCDACPECLIVAFSWASLNLPIPLLCPSPLAHQKHQRIPNAQTASRSRPKLGKCGMRSLPRVASGWMRIRTSIESPTVYRCLNSFHCRTRLYKTGKTSKFKIKTVNIPPSIGAAIR